MKVQIVLFLWGVGSGLITLTNWLTSFFLLQTIVIISAFNDPPYVHLYYYFCRFIFFHI